MKSLLNVYLLLLPTKWKNNQRNNETLFSKFIKTLCSVKILPINSNSESELSFSIFSVRTLISFVIGCAPMIISSALVFRNYQFYEDFLSASSRTFTIFDLTLTYIGIFFLRQSFTCRKKDE